MEWLRMRMVILGAAGRTGRALIAEAVARGHDVTGYTRRPELLADIPGIGTVVHGDVSDPVMMERAVAGQDGVLSVVGPTRRDDSRVVVDAARVITAVMNDVAVRRLVVASSYLIVADRPRVSTALARIGLARTLAAQEAADRVVMQSGLDWTVVRCTRLVDEPPRGEVQLSTDLLRTGPWTTPRGDLAIVMLDLVEDPDWIQTTANVTGAPPGPARGERGVPGKRVA
jgi:putative NADH-flavin reductase